MKAKEAIQFYTESDIAGQIRGAYQQPAWTVLSSLRDATGWAGKGQTADAMAFGTWPSRGFKVIGFEIKSYRGDWLRELKNPAKAETFAQYCDEWWIVATENVVKLEEVPAVWGWATPTQRGLKRIKEPQTITAKDINRVFLMAIMRNVGTNYTPTKDVKALIEEGVEKELERRRDSALLNLKYREDECVELRKRIKDFEDKAGFQLESWRWDAASIGALVKEITEGDLHHHLTGIERAGQGVKEVLDKIHSIPFFKSKEAT